ncbi:hypothetical protein HNQ77_004180 [Silvibacterium bohemicum]|uniref:Uncharacterized protein n=1 Tax=Silvibacterium bohemicum TaxID=1577686 RepID=A0A841K6J6_9BACT|nr:hypothetical protein [Silvibacterium bohemicum]MBB6146208.1 hypothetical protein [Silvibacterium bohemicum]
MLKRSALAFFCALQIWILLISAEKPAHAYVDPGSGLLVFQVGGSMLAGALFVMRAKIRKLFGLNAKTESDPNLPKEDAKTLRPEING